MKRYVMLFAFTIAVAIWLLVYPMISSLRAPGVSVFKVSYNNLSTSVQCEGTVFAAKQQVINYGYTIKPDKVYVCVGQTVASGQKLFDIDKQDTLQAFSSIQGMTNYNGYNSYTSSLQGSYDPSSSYSSDSRQYYDSNSQQSSSDDSSASVGPQDVPDSVYSTIAGVVTESDLQEGNFTQPTNTLLTITDMNSIRVKAQVDERYISQVRVGAAVAISPITDDKIYNGTVEQIYPAAYSIISGTGKKTVVDVIIKINKNGEILKPGYNTQVKIYTAKDKKVLLVPYESIEQDDHNVKYVFLNIGGKAVRRNIVTGQSNLTTVEVVNGLKAGEEVLYDPPVNLKSSMKIRSKMKSLKIDDTDTTITDEN